MIEARLAKTPTITMANQNKEKRNQSEINVIEERERGSDQK